MNCSHCHSRKHAAIPFNQSPALFDLERTEIINPNVAKWRLIDLKASGRQTAVSCLPTGALRFLQYVHCTIVRQTAAPPFKIQYRWRIADQA